MFAEAALGKERGGVAVAWNLCPISRRREDIVKEGLAGLKELWVKEARQVPASCGAAPRRLPLGSIHQCLSLAGPAEITPIEVVMSRCALRGADHNLALI
jgi:hypothetical protein